MSLRMTRAIALATVLALGLGACGDDDDDTSTEDEAPTTEDEGEGEGDAGATEGALVSLEDECEAAQADGVEAPEGFRVNLVTDIGRIDDGTFNQFAYEGMTAAEECFGFETSYIETVSEADYATNIATTLSDQPDVVITNGFLLATDTLAAAEDNTDVNFIGIDQFQEEFPANYVGMLFREDQGGYLAGVLAASLSESGVIGVVGGREDVPPVVRFVNAYEAGAKSINPDIRVLSVYNESFTTPDKGASDAAQFIGEGADVIFGAGGQTGSGGVAAASRAGRLGHRRRPGRVLHHVQRWRRGRVGVPGDLGDQACRPRRVPQHRGGDPGRVRGRRLHPRGRQRRHHLRAVPRRGDPRGRGRHARGDPPGLADGSIDTGVDPSRGCPTSRSAT